jgi:hypothetical protein
MLWKAGELIAPPGLESADQRVSPLPAPSPDIHRLLPRRPQKPWKCGQFAVRKMRAFRM